MGCIIKRLITLTVPIRNQRINLTYEGTDITSSCLFSWSCDGVCWTNWVTYDQYTALISNVETDFYLRILIVTGFDTLFLNGCAVKCYNICLYSENPYITDLCTNQSVDFYAGLDCALQMYNQLSNLICCMIGIPCYYFRVLPDQDTTDLTFKEYVLHNVVDMKHLKLICEDGAMPSSKPMMTEFDFDWDSDWEVEMSKDSFAKAFGDSAFPKQRDMIYIPMMKRMWDVNSAYDEKNEGFMWRPTTWKLGLVKWNDKTNINQGDFEDIIDSWTQNRMDNFNAWADEEQLHETGVVLFDAPEYVPENLTNLMDCDAVRATIPSTELHSVNHVQLNHRSAVVVRDTYAFKDPESEITYQHFFRSDSGMLMFIIQPTGVHDMKKLFGIGAVEVWSSGDHLVFNGLDAELETGSTYLVHCRWNRTSFTTEMNIYKHICVAEPGMPTSMIRPEMYIFDFKNAVASLTGPYNNDFINQAPVRALLSPAPDLITNIKVYECPLNTEDACRESLKYVTKDKRCIINDPARPFVEEMGFSTR